jgi:hypothetical protein
MFGPHHLDLCWQEILNGYPHKKKGKFLYPYFLMIVPGSNYIKIADTVPVDVVNNIEICIPYHNGI